MGRRIRACAAFVVLAASAAAADPLGDAKNQVAASDYLNARASLDAAFNAGSASPEQLAEIWRLRGIVAGALNETKPATEAFEKCLALNPKAELPPGTSPKITRPFTAAHDKVKTPLRIKAETASSPPLVTVLISSDPLAMITKIQVAVKVDGGAETKLEGVGKDKVTIDLPSGGRLDLRVAALDEKGNHLAELGTTEVPIVIIGKKADDGKHDVKITVGPEPSPSPTPRPVTPVKQRGFFWRWYVWGGAAVVFGGTATYFGIDGLMAKSDLEDLNRSSANHSFDEAKSTERRARRDFLISNIGYGVAGAFAIGAAILWLTEPKQPTEQRVTAVPLDGGGAIVFGGHF